MATSLPYITSLVISVASLCPFVTAAFQQIGFSVDLIHRDSLVSPFYDPQATSRQRWSDAVKRSYHRAKHISQKILLHNQPYSDLINDDGVFLMNVSIGTPAFPILALADTGSNVVWTQCEPCTKCMNITGPRFDPKKSTTYRPINCNAPQCRIVDGADCELGTDDCVYSVEYEEGTTSSGEVAFETITLKSKDGTPVAFEDIIIGCSNANNGSLPGEREAGVIGLGAAPNSFIMQIKESIAGTFSYCLLPWDFKEKPTKINFGSNAHVSGPGVASTRLYTRDDQKHFFFLNLEAISVGDYRFEFPNYTPNTGNIIIDSGTTATVLPEYLYHNVAGAMRRLLIDAEEVADPESKYELCFRPLDGVEIPKTTMHFEGADVVLGRDNTFVRIEDYDEGNLDCFTFGAATDDIPVYGIVSQVDFLVGYDVVSKTVAFKPTDCTRS